MPRFNVSGAPAAKAFRPNSSGKYYFEVSNALAQFQPRIGVCNSAQVLTSGSGGDQPLGGTGNKGIGLSAQGAVRINNVVVLTLPSWEAADYVPRIAVNCRLKRIWFAAGAGDWNLDPTANPRTNVGGIDISAIVGTLYIAAQVATFGESLHLNAGQSAFAYTRVPGFAAPRTTFDPANTGAGAALSVGNTTVTNAGGGLGYAVTRSVKRLL